MHIVRNARCHRCHVTQERTILAAEDREPAVACMLCGGETSLSKPAYHQQADRRWLRECGDKDVIGGY